MATSSERRPGARQWVPPEADVSSLREAVHGCRGCELWAPATQAVFSSGPDGAAMMLVGEQPGDAEDRAGEPFVGPAGRVLHDALEEAGIEPGTVYVTNAVKHFRHEERGKRRLHKKPAIAHIRACGPWLGAEVEAVAPRVVVCLGATAARAVLGYDVKVTQDRGAVLRDDALQPPDGANGGPGAAAGGAGGAAAGVTGSLPVGAAVVVTAHPSSVLRLRGREGWREAFDELVTDLRAAAAAGR